MAKTIVEEAKPREYVEAHGVNIPVPTGPEHDCAWKTLAEIHSNDYDNALAELATLRAQLAEVTAERDAASKAYNDAGRCLYDAKVRENELRAEVATLTAERDFAVAFGQALAAERDEEQRVASILLRQRDKATEDRDAARAEVERMRAVVEAARACLVVPPGSSSRSQSMTLARALLALASRGEEG